MVVKYFGNIYKPTEGGWAGRFLVLIWKGVYNLKTVKIILVTILLLMYTNIAAIAMEPETSGKAAVLIDGSNGRILFEKNSSVKLPMASTTKIMTAIAALENGNLNDMITIPPEASGIEGSSIWLSPGETHSLRDLLYALMLRSGNDAATAIAIHIGGSVNKFVDMMNKTAKRIGAENTNFINPHGLHDDNHYSTAYDLALIASYGLKNPVFEEIVSTKYYTIPWEGHDWDRALRNKNKILWTYEGANGVKTGYTKKAGRCFVGSAKRNGMQLIAVVLNCGPMFEESMALMDYGFENYKNVCIFKHGQLIDSLPVRKGILEKVDVVTEQEYTLALNKLEQKQVKTKVMIPNSLDAPVEKGQRVGSIKIYLKDELINEIPIIAKESVRKKTVWDFFCSMVNIWR